MIRPEDIKELNEVFADLNDVDTGANRDGVLDVPSARVSENTSENVEPIVEVLAEILSELQSLNEYLRQ
tara:strand:- start:1037 stop:1243 length:207 start_codon:yes stop_codon:yes gene_type:complete